MEDNKIEEGVSLGEIFGWIWAKKIIGLIVTVVLFLLIVIGLKYVYNPGAISYSVKFSYENIPYLASGKYVDGSAFNYRDIINRNTVNKLVEENDEFKSVDLDALLNTNSFSISEVTTYVKDGDPTSGVLENYYLIKAPYKAFNSEDDAIKFLNALIMNPINKDRELIDNLSFDANFDLMQSATSYTTELESLTNQVNLILSGYETLISEYGDTVVYLNNQQVVDYATGGVQYKLSQLKTRLNNKLTESGFYSLSNELNAKGYVKNPEAEKAVLENRIVSLEEENKNLEIKIEALQTQLDSILQSSSSNQIIVTDAIKDLVNQITDLTNKKVNNQIEITSCKKKIETINSSDLTASNAFGERLKSVEEMLKEETKTYTSVCKYIYTRDADVVYLNSNIVDTNGGISTILILVAGAFVGLFVGVVVAGTAGYLKVKKEEKVVAAPKLSE